VIASVAICTWNRAALLDQTLAQCQKLKVDEPWELIVVNNNCTDDTDAVVRKFEAILPVRLIHERSPGKVSALNRAIAEARGTYLLFTDDDALVEPDWVSRTLACFRETAADMVFGRVTPWWETAPPTWFAPLLSANFALLDYGDTPFVADTMAKSPFGVNYAFRKSVFDEIGLYKTDLGPRGGQGFGGEDDEIFRRMLLAKKKVQYDPAILVRHFVPKLRCEKAYHRMRSWRGSGDHLALLKDEALQYPHLPTVFGTPRYFWRINLGYVISYVKSMITFDRPASFFYELKLIRMMGLMKCLMKRSGSRDPKSAVGNPRRPGMTSDAIPSVDSGSRLQNTFS
jgi:glycosyltransferase involved in cell wall biosynthesis